MTYTGGPGSILGVGNTGIRYVDDINRTGLYNYQAKSPNLKPYFDGTYKPVFTPNNYLKNLFDVTLNKGAFGKYSRLIGLSQILYDVLQPYNTEGKLTGVYNHNVYEPTVEGNTWPKNSPLIYNNDTFTYTQEDIIQTNINPPNGVNLSPKTQDFRKVLREKLGTFKPNTRTSEESGATSLAPSYNIADNKTIEGRTNLGDPGARAGKSYANYANGIPYPQINISTPGLVGSAPTGLDKINSIPLYRSKEVAQDSQVNDLVKFRIAVIDNNNPNFKTFVHFRAFIDSMNDSYTGDWSSFQYIGRGEKFYTYNGFSRQISLSWTVAAQSKQELIPMYKKLNYLASTLAPNYSNQGYMRGVFCQLTVGGYLYEQPGFITSLTYDVPTDSPWEIGINTDGGSDNSVKELPHIIKVSSFNFTPIHRFIPERQKNLYGTDGDSFVSTYGDQKYIALTNGFTDNYND